MPSAGRRARPRQDRRRSISVRATAPSPSATALPVHAKIGAAPSPSSTALVRANIGAAPSPSSTALVRAKIGAAPSPLANALPVRATAPSPSATALPVRATAPSPSATALPVRAKIGAAPASSATPARGWTSYPAAGKARSDVLVPNPRAFLGGARSSGLLVCVRNGRSGGLAGNAVFSRRGLRYFSEDCKKVTGQKNDVTSVGSKKIFLPGKFEKLHHSMRSSIWRYWGIIKEWWPVFEGVMKVCLILSSTVGGLVVYYSLNMSLYEAFGLLQYLHYVKSAQLKTLVEAYRKHAANPDASDDDGAEANPELMAAIDAVKTAWSNAVYSAKESARVEAMADVENRVQAAYELGHRNALAEWINALDDIKKRGV